MGRALFHIAQLLVGFINFQMHESLEADPQYGCPFSFITQQNIVAVQDLANEDPHISIDYIVTIWIYL